MTAKSLSRAELERFSSFEPDPFDAVSFAWYGHVPQIDVTALERLPVLRGVVTTLTFDEWRSLEGLNAWDWESYFGSGQTFAGGAVRAERSSAALPLRTLVTAAGQAAEQFWLLATTTFDTFTVHPHLSSGYSSCRGTDGRLRIFRARGIGELECLRLPVRITMQREHREILDRNAALIDVVWESELASVLDAFASIYSRTISAAALSDVWLDFVAQLELFLNPRGDRPLGRTFSERLASLCALQPDELPAYREAGKAMYDFRSETLHGKRPDAARAASVIGHHYPFPSTILRRCIELMAHVCSGGDQASDLSPARLVSGDRAFLTDAYLDRAPARLQTIEPSFRVHDEADNLDLVDYEASFPVSGPDEAERIRAALSALAGEGKAHE
jgi:hypothetical protein